MQNPIGEAVKIWLNSIHKYRENLPVEEKEMLHREGKCPGIISCEHCKADLEGDEIYGI